MNRYHYKISLRVRHPSLDPAEITSALHLNPFRTWRAGEPRATPRGTPLEGTNRGTYWAVDIAEGEFPSKELEAVIGEALDRLVPYRGFFQRIRLEGGDAEFFVGWFFDEQSGAAFDCDLMARMADLKIDLALDVYPP